MGYYTRLDGTLTITPPAPWSALRDRPRLTEFGQGVLRIRVDERTEEIDDGYRVVKQGVEVETYQDQVKAYQIEAELQDIVDAMPDHQFRGYITGEGEDVGDYWRLTVNDERKVVKEKARLVWPDGSEVSPG